MELRQIQYFIQLYKDLNITRASRNLYISQQGLSKSINRLEEELGFSLFHRYPSGVTPTDEANALYGHFIKIADSYYELTMAVENIRHNRILKIAAFHGFALSCNKNSFTEYRQLHPEVQFHYEEQSNQDIPNLLLERKANIAFMSAPIPKELSSLKLIRKETVYVVVDRNHPLAQKENILVSDLSEQSLLLLDIMEEFNSIILKEADILDIPYQIYDRVNMNEFLHILHSSDLVGFSSRRLYRYYAFPEVVFIPLLLGNNVPLMMETHLVTVKGISPNEELQRYIDYELHRSEHIE